MIVVFVSLCLSATHGDTVCATECVGLFGATHGFVPGCLAAKLGRTAGAVPMAALQGERYVCCGHK
jgi:hypothetical protein